MTNDVIQNYKCRYAFKPGPHSKVAIRPSSLDSLANIIIDIIHLEGKKYLHSIDECTTWSGVVKNFRKIVEVQKELRRRTQCQQHRRPN